MQVILDSSFVRPGSAPIRGGKKGEFRDWTNQYSNMDPRLSGQTAIFGVAFFVSKSFLGNERQ